MRATYSLFAFLISATAIHAQTSTPEHTQPRRSPGILFSSVIQGFNDIASVIQDTLHLALEPPDEGSNLRVSEDAYFNITQLGEKHGYRVEEHSVKTVDGYIIDIHRIPRGSTGATNNLVVFLMHGLIESSESWVLQGPDNSLAYILADQGFDVWMGNARGNKYAQRHATLRPDHKDFWEFTWDEIGAFDLPAMIDYVLQTTDKEDLYYVGYSQGTTTLYVMNSLKPAYNKKIKMAFSLAPVALMANVRSPLIRMFSPASDFMASLLLHHNVMNTEYLNSMVMPFCVTGSFACTSIMHMIVGRDSKFIDDSMKLMLKHKQTTSSILQLMHYGQLVHSGRFCKFDFGKEMNLDTYGTETPPEYDLSKVTVPNVVFYSENDWLADPIDVKELMIRLPNVHNSSFITDFNHLDFIYAPVAKDVVYSKIVKYILNFEKTEGDDENYETFDY